jgi:hypothetical protein
LENSLQNPFIAIGIIGSGVDPKTKDFRLVLKLSDQKPLYLNLQQGMVSNLALSAWAALRDIAPADEGGQALMQPLTLVSGRPFVTPDGRAGLVLDMEGMRVPVIFPVEAISLIQASLEQLRDMTKTSTQTKLN